MTMKTPKPLTHTLPLRSFLLIIGALALCSPGCNTTTRPAGHSVTLGAVAPLTGKYSEWGQYFREGLELAFDDLAKAPGGPRMTLVLEDNKSDVKEALNALARIQSLHKPVAVISMDTPTLQALAPKTTQEGTLLLGTIAGGKLPFTSDQLAVRWYQNASAIASAMSGFVADRRIPSVGIIYENHVFGRSIVDGLKQRFAAANVAITAAETFEASDSESKGQVLKVLSSKPTLMIIAGTGAGPFASTVVALRQYGWRGPTLCTYALILPATLKETAEAAEGVYFAAGHFDPYNPTTPRQKHFAEIYEVKYKRKPSDAAAYTYEYVLMLNEFLNNGATSGTELYKVFSGLSNRDTVFGPVSSAGPNELSFPVIIRKVVKNRGNTQIEGVSGGS